MTKWEAIMTDAERYRKLEKEDMADAYREASRIIWDAIEKLPDDIKFLALIHAESTFGYHLSARWSQYLQNIEGSKLRQPIED